MPSLGLSVIPFPHFHVLILKTAHVGHPTDNTNITSHKYHLSQFLFQRANKQTTLTNKLMRTLRGAPSPLMPIREGVLNTKLCMFTFCEKLLQCQKRKSRDSSLN